MTTGEKHSPRKAMEGAWPDLPPDITDGELLEAVGAMIKVYEDRGSDADCIRLSRRHAAMLLRMAWQTIGEAE